MDPKTAPARLVLGNASATSPIGKASSPRPSATLPAVWSGLLPLVFTSIRGLLVREKASRGDKELTSFTLPIAPLAAPFRPSHKEAWFINSSLPVIGSAGGAIGPDRGAGVFFSIRA